MSRYTETLDRLLVDAEALVARGEYAEAEARAMHVLSRQPRNATAHAVLALSSLAQSRPDAALRHLEGALRADRVNAHYHYLAGLALAALGRGEEAVASQRRALQFSPRFPEARAQLGLAHERAGRFAEAAGCYRRLVEEVPADETAWARLAFCERMLGRAAEAVAAIERVIALRPSFAPAHNELGLALLHAGRRAEAAAALRRAVELEPGYAGAWRNLAKLLYVSYVESIGKPQAVPVEGLEGVLEVFERLLAVDPGDVEMAYLRASLRGERPARPPDEFIAGFFDRFAGDFEAKLVGELRYRAPEEARALLAPRLAGRRWRVLDLGCGTGLSGESLRGADMHLTGVDLSEGMLERARARSLYDHLERAEIGEYLARIPAGSLDLVLALDVFIYVGELERVMEPCARVLAPGGLLAFTTESLATGDYALLQGARYAHSDAYVTAQAQRSGLRVVEAHELAIRTEAGRPVPGVLYLFEKA